MGVQQEQKSKQLLADMEAEQAVLAWFFYNPILLPKWQEKIKSSHFWKDGHQHIYQAMFTLSAKNYQTTVANVERVLLESGTLEEVGDSEGRQGRAYLEYLEYSLLTAQFPLHEVVDRLVSKATQRQVYYLAHDMARWAGSGDQDLVQKSLSALQAIAHGSSTKTPVSFKDAVADYIRDLRQRKEDRKVGITRGIPTGYADLDKMIGGLQPGELLILGALTGWGKSSFSLSIAINIATQAKRAMVFTLEMSVSSVVQRAFANRSGINSAKLRDAHVTPEELDDLEKVAEEMATYQILVDDFSQDIESICLRVREAHSREPLHLVIVDYIQLLSIIKERGNRAQDLSDIGRKLKLLAQELQITVLALVQLNREVERRGSLEPTLADINESGGIAHHCDVVLLLFSEKEALEARNAGKPFVVFCKVPKARSARLGMFPLLFDPAHMRYTEELISYEDE